MLPGSIVSPHRLWPFTSSFPALRSLEVDLTVSRCGVYRLAPQLGLQSIPLSKIRMGMMVMGFFIKSVLALAHAFTSLEEFGVLYEDVWQTDLVKTAEAIQWKVKVLRFTASYHPGAEYERDRRPSPFDLSAWILHTITPTVLSDDWTGMSGSLHR